MLECTSAHTPIELASREDAEDLGTRDEAVLAAGERRELGVTHAHDGPVPPST